MNLKEKPLYALRDLAARLGVLSPTKYTKPELIEAIYERKTQIENHTATPQFNNLGRPKLDNRFIAIKKHEDGTISFYETIQPQTADIRKELKKEEILIVKRPSAIKDNAERKKLTRIKELMQDFCFAIEKVLERE